MNQSRAKSAIDIRRGALTLVGILLLGFLAVVVVVRVLVEAHACVETNASTAWGA